MTKENNLPKKISAGLIDCDLYGGYQISLKCFGLNFKRMVDYFR